MKICTIGDLHGRPIWKEVIPVADKYDKIIFLADYMDSMDYVENDVVVRKAYTNEEHFNNFLEIIQFKKDNEEKVELFEGNHDGSYFHFPKYYCQGFRPEAQPAITALYNDNKHLFKVAYQYKNYIWTHAGITNAWFREFKELAIEKGIWDDSLPIADMLNMANECSLQEKLYQKSGKRMAYAESDQKGGILWADRSETREDSLDGYHQIVGHTPISRNTTLIFPNGSITYTDSLHSEGGGFYELEIP